jgi:sulfur carrier protein
MTITLNGASHELSGPISLQTLLEQVGLAGRPVVIEHNRIALLPREYAKTLLNEGDVVELVQITAGG